MWQFTLIDFTQNPNGQSTAINEPVGWDATNLHLKRDDTLHGFFSFEDDSFSSLQYDGAAADILRNAYYNFGVEAVVQLGIAYVCDAESAADNLYLGQFDFTTFVEYIGDRCYIECATIVSESMILYKKRADQQVDLDSLASADQLPVTQYVTGNAQFESGTNLIRVQQLLNGLLPGSQVTISGAANAANNGAFYVASAKPDWSNVNPDASGEGIVTSLTCSATFNPSNNTITVNQLLDVQPGTQLQVIGTGNITYSFGPYFTCNDGIYNVVSVQQFFNYTVFTVALHSIASQAQNPINYGTGGTPATGAYFTSQSVDSVVLQPTPGFTTIPQPDSTIIQVPLQPVNLVSEDGTGAVCTGSISGTVLTITVVASRTLRVGQGIGMGNIYIVNFGTGTGGTGTYNLSNTTPITLASSRITTGILFTGQWLKNNMAPYKYLGKVITVPGKEIIATSLYQATYNETYKLITPLGSGTFGGPIWLVPDWPAVISDIDETDIGTGLPNYEPSSTTPGDKPLDTQIFFRQGSLACWGEGTLTINVNGQFATVNGAWPSSGMNFADPENITNYNQFRIQAVIDTQWNGPYLSPGPALVVDQLITCDPTTKTFSFNQSYPNIYLEPGQYLWIYFYIYIGDVDDSNLPVLNISAGTGGDTGCFFEFVLTSQCEDTPCATYFVNEAMSRCVESYTNGAMQVYSDYFGRTNAQPVASAQNGCGSLECITNGVRIRGCIMPDGSAIPKMFISLKEMLTALDAIHNIGVGLEADPNRPGFSRLRVEPYEWFFNNTVLLTCDNIFLLDRTVQPNLLPSTFDVGYEQFETWNNNGLYDIFGKRTYRTPLNQVTQGWNKVCQWMASDYAIEFTRRDFGVTTSDSRYDDSTFILCLTGSYDNNIEIVKNCILVIATPDTFIAGDTITIAGAANSGNNGNFIIALIQQADVPGNAPGLLSYVYFSGSPAFTNEFNSDINFTNGGTHYNNVPVYFISSTGAVVLDDEPLYGASIGDVIQITSGVFTGNITVQNVFSPQSALQEGETGAFDFPMLIYPTTYPAVIGGGDYNTTDAALANLTNTFYAVEQAMENGTNILSPSTVMNYRISPGHNAMRHYRNVITDRNFANQTLIFTGGDGNFYALGQLSDSCSPEDGNISEGGNLNLNNFTTPQDGEPLFYAEIIKFEYPLSWANFLSIQANPYGLIQFRQNSAEPFMEGWLVDLQYKPYEGMASFQVYPKIGNSSFSPEPVGP